MAAASRPRAFQWHSRSTILLLLLCCSLSLQRSSPAAHRYNKLSLDVRSGQIAPSSTASRTRPVTHVRCWLYFHTSARRGASVLFYFFSFLLLLYELFFTPPPPRDFISPRPRRAKRILRARTRRSRA